MQIEDFFLLNRETFEPQAHNLPLKMRQKYFSLNLKWTGSFQNKID